MKQGLLPFELEQITRNRWRVLRRGCVSFECDSRTLTEFLRASGITPDQRRRLFEDALERIRAARREGAP